MDASGRGGRQPAPVPPGAETVAALTEALDRLAAGRATHTDGRLTVTNLAHEAGVARSTAHRAPEVLAALRLLAAQRRVVAARQAVDRTDAYLGGLRTAQGQPQPVSPVGRPPGAGSARSSGSPDLRITPTGYPGGLTVEGDIDTHTVDSLRHALRVVAAQHTDEVHVDLTRVTFIEVDGMRLFADLATALAAARRRLVLGGLAPHLRAVIRLLGWDETPGLRIGADGRP